MNVLDNPSSIEHLVRTQSPPATEDYQTKLRRVALIGYEQLTARSPEERQRQREETHRIARKLQRDIEISQAVSLSIIEERRYVG